MGKGLDGEAPFQVERDGGVIRLSGDLRLPQAAALWSELVGVTRDPNAPAVFDLSRVRAIDGAVIALLVELRGELAERGIDAELKGAGGRVEPLVEMYAKGARRGPEAPTAAEPRGVLASLGRIAVRAREELTNALDFLGRLAAALAALAKRPRCGHWDEVPRLAERAGADALPIVLTINALVGFAMAYQSAKELELYGANVYVADLVGISMTRELAPLMTAIVVSGRSGAAYTAEIGTMAIDGEIDALRTFGIQPFHWLVIPRLVALVCVVPLLTILADIVGAAGGLVVAVADLGVSPYGYLLETSTAVHGRDVATGVVKSLVFAVAIALIACRQGFATSGGAEGVGRRTTSTVVTSLFVLVVLDAGINIVLRLFQL